MFYKTIYFTVLFFFASIILPGCQKEFGLTPGTVEEPVLPKDFVQYTIKPGENSSMPSPYTPVEYDELKFIVRFDSSAIYATADTANQWDVNKLYGFADNNGHHHSFSARFGWRWKDGELHLFSYLYNNGIRTDNDIGKVAIGKEHTCSIRIAGDKYIFTLNGVATTWPRLSTTPKAIGYKLYPFFGGDEPAPHTIHIWIKEI